MLLPGCGPGSAAPAGRDLAWSQVRLAVTEPLTMEPAGVESESAPRPAVRPVTTSLGRARPFPDRDWGGREIAAVEMAVGAAATWRVVLGEDAYLTFMPLGTAESMGGAGSTAGPASPVGVGGTVAEKCEATYVVSAAGRADDGGGQAGPRRELHAEPVVAAGMFAAPQRQVDLSSLTGTIDLTLAVRVDGEGGDCPVSVEWGNPLLVSRMAPVVERPAPERPASESPNVLILGFDTFRADRLGRRQEGFASLTPAMDRLAAESDIWSRAFSTFNNTNPSFASIFTGLYGKNHGIYDLRTPLPEGHRTLAEVFDEAGYDTFAVISARHLSPRVSGLGQGFDRVVTPHRYFAAETVVDEAMGWLEGRRGRPFFAWLHFFDPHTPTLPPRPYANGRGAAGLPGLAPVRDWRPFRTPGPREFSERRLGGHPDLYDGEVAYLDRQVDRLMAFLGQRGLLADTFVVLVADHGESLGEHGILHSHVGLHDPTVHVPMLMRWPARWRHRRPPVEGPLDGLVQTLDLYPTLLRAAGLGPANGVDGVDLYRLGAEGRPAVFMEHANGYGAAVRTRRYKYVDLEDQPRLGGPPRLYDLEADPGETEDVSAARPEEAARLADVLRRWRRERREAGATAGPVPPSAEVGEEDLEQLRSLGYLR